MARCIRPHDIEVFTHGRIAGAVPGRILRVVRVGFEVRLTVALTDEPDAEPVLVTVTRATQRHLGLDEAVEVWIAPTRGAAVPLLAPAVAVGI